MKLSKKLFGLFSIGILTSTLLYPLLHESGHILVSLVVNAKISSINLFPLPSITCELNATNSLTVVYVGFGGMLLPYLISLVPPKKHFWTWYIWFVISGICLLSFSISMTGVILYKTGNPIVNEDITQAMIYAPKYYILYIAILITLSFIRIIQVIRSHPIQQCLNQFWDI